MARPLRLQFDGAIYHVTARGNARQSIFAGDTDRHELLDLLSSVVSQYRWLCHAYCLMENHYHLLLETPEPNLSRGMRQLNGSYTQRFNRRQARVGHLFQGRFKAVLVDREGYLLELCRYVVLNPVRAHLVAAPESYPWSSYRATCGLDSPPPWLTTDWLLSQFAEGPSVARRRYREFVKEGLDRESPWAELHGQVLLGRREFVAKLSPILQEKAEAREIPRQQRLAARPSLDMLLPAGAPLDRDSRNRAMRDAHVKHSYTLSEIGRHAGLHYATVSRIIRRQTS